MCTSSEAEPSASHVVTLPILGVDTSFETSSERVIQLIEEEFGHWKDLAGTPGLVRRSSGRVRIDVRDAVARPLAQVRIDYGLPGEGRMTAACAYGGGVADVRRLEAIVSLESGLLAQPELVARGLVEPLALFLVGAQDRVPLHAAAVRRGDTGIVLAGPSGTGKSMLVYSATCAGYEALADDPVYIQTDPILRVWGRRGQVHLRPDAGVHFPELAGRDVTQVVGGKAKIVVDTGGGRRYADRVGLCILRRGAPGRPGLTRITPAEAREELTRRLDSGFDLFRETLGERVERVAANGAWILDLGASPRDCVALLDEVAEALEADGGRGH